MLWRLSFLLFSICITSCSHASKRKEHTALQGSFGNIAWSIEFATPVTSQDAERIYLVADQCFQQLDRSINNWNPNAEVSYINRTKKVHIPIPVSNSFTLIFQKCDALYRLTDGRFNPALEAARMYWRRISEKIEKFDEKVFKKVQESCKWSHFSLSDRGIAKSHPDARLDFQAIFKGIWIDLMVEKMRSLEYENFLIEWGGECCGIGQHPQQRPWQVVVRSLLQKNTHPMMQWALNTKSVATSGDDHQYWLTQVHEQSYLFSHIIDPKTCMPKKIDRNSISLVSVRGTSATLCDALATTGMTFDKISHLDTWIYDVGINTFPGYEFFAKSRAEIA